MEHARDMKFQEDEDEIEEEIEVEETYQFEAFENNTPKIKNRKYK